MPPSSECKHCRSPVGPDASFCCTGCEAVFLALQGDGFADYYRLRDVDREALLGVAAQPREAGDAGSYAYLDTAAYRGGHCESLQFVSDDGPTAGFETTWAVAGMTCVACAWVIEEVGKKTDGVREIRVDVMRREVHLRFDANTSLRSLADGIGQFGYGVALPGTQADSAAASRRELVQLAIAGAIAANTMMLTLPYYTGLESGGHAALFGWFSLVLATISVVGPGRVFFRNAAAALRLGMASLDLPIGLGVAAAWLYSVVQTFFGRWHELYFDSLTVLVFALLVGRFFQSRAVDRAVARAQLLAATMPQLVSVMRGGRWQSVAPETLAVGELLRIEPGEMVPCDVRLLVGPRTVNLQVSTGEEAPQRLHVDANLPAGARAVDQMLEVEVRQISTMLTGEEPQDPAAAAALRAGPVRAGPESTASLRTVPMLADRLGGYFTAVVITVAALAFAGWTWTSGIGEGLRVAMTVLIVACPCAIGLATPVTAAMTIAAAARHGVLVRTASVLERLSRIDIAVFDKTGTLTVGQPEVVEARWWALPADIEMVSRALHALESSSKHPIARGLCRWLEAGDEPRFKAVKSSFQRSLGQIGTAQQDATDDVHVTLLPGEGIVGAVADVRLLSISATAAARHGLAYGSEAQDWVERAEARGHTVVCVWRLSALAFGADAEFNPRLDTGAELILCLALRDAIRADAAATLAELQQRFGIRAVLLSGDHQRAVDMVASRLGINDARGGASPTEKLRMVAELEQRNAVMMVGDGYNDVPALRGASLAVTLASGTSGAIDASEVVLQAGGIAGLLRLCDDAVRARRVIRTTLAFALAYNAVGMGLAVAGWITPLLAAVLMPLSSGTVVSYAVWASRTRHVSPISPSAISPSAGSQSEPPAP